MLVNPGLGQLKIQVATFILRLQRIKDNNKIHLLLIRAEAIMQSSALMCAVIWMGLHRGDQLGERLKAVVAVDGSTSATEAITTDHTALHSFLAI